MKLHKLAVIGLAALAVAPAQAWAQGSATRIKPSSIPRTADGHPNLEGFWTNITLTPLERPADLAGKEFFTAKEAADYARNLVERRNRDQRNRGTVGDVQNAYNDFWWDSGTKVVKTLRTSLVVDPPDGRIPALTAERKKQI